MFQFFCPEEFHPIRSMKIVFFIVKKDRCRMHLQRQKNMLAFDILREWISEDIRPKMALSSNARNLSFFSNRSQIGLGERMTKELSMYLHGIGSEDSKIVIKALEPYCITPLHFCSSKEKLSDVDIENNGNTSLLVDVDAIGDLEDAVDELITFRKKYPNVVVVMISAFVLSDDFGTYRQLICDATLRSPVSQGRVKGGLTAAILNKMHSMPSIITAA